MQAWIRLLMAFNKWNCKSHILTFYSKNVKKIQTFVPKVLTYS